MKNTNSSSAIASLVIVIVILVFMCMTVILLFMPGLLPIILGYTLAFLAAFYFGMLMLLGLILAIFKVVDKIHYYTVLREIRRLELERQRRQTFARSRTPWWSEQDLRQSSIQHRSHDPDDYGC